MLCKYVSRVYTENGSLRKFYSPVMKVVASQVCTVETNASTRRKLTGSLESRRFYTSSVPIRHKYERSGSDYDDNRYEEDYERAEQSNSLFQAAQSGDVRNLSYYLRGVEGPDALNAEELAENILEV